MRRALLAVFFVACAHQPASEPPAANGCADFTGQYRFDSASCRTAMKEIAVDVAVWPDLSILPRTDAIVGIHQEGCESVGIAVRGEDASDSWSRRAFTATSRADGAALTGEVTTDSAPPVPPPFVIAPHAGYYWRLQRDGDRVRYTMQFRERSFFLFFPLTNTRTVSCTMTPM